MSCLFDPGCTIQAFFFKDAAMKKKPEPNPVFVACKSTWLDEVHKGWTFGDIQGKKLKSIISKIKQVCKNKGLEGTDEQIINSFRRMCQQLPDWFKDKDLQVIDSKFNEIIVQIQQGKTNGRSYQNQPSAARVFGKYDW